VARTTSENTEIATKMTVKGLLITTKVRIQMATIAPIVIARYTAGDKHIMVELIETCLNLPLISKTQSKVRLSFSFIFEES